MSVLAGLTLAASTIGGSVNWLTQMEEQSYERKMQQESWNREDTAVQRRAADLQAAGINPLLAAGSAASTSSPIKTAPPQFGGGNIAENYFAVKSAELALMKGREDIATTRAQRGLIETQARKNKIESDFMESVNPYKITQESLNAEFAQNTFGDKVQQFRYTTEKYGLENQNLKTDLALKAARISQMEVQTAIDWVKKKVMDKYAMDVAEAELFGKQLALLVQKNQLSFGMPLPQTAENAKDLMDQIRKNQDDYKKDKITR